MTSSDEELNDSLFEAWTRFFGGRKNIICIALLDAGFQPTVSGMQNFQSSPDDNQGEKKEKETWLSFNGPLDFCSPDIHNPS